MLMVISRFAASRGAMNAAAAANASMTTAMPARSTKAIGGGPRNLSTKSPTTVVAPQA